MPRANPLQAAFNAGELGPRMAGRVDFAKYRSAGARVENMTPLPQGGLTRRPGTRFIAATADQDKRPRLIPFEFSTEQAYVLEAGDGRFRFFRNKGQVAVPPTDAAISNGSFDSNINSWDDTSTDGAFIAYSALIGNADKISTLGATNVTHTWWGDGVAGRRYLGFRVTTMAAGYVSDAQVQIATPTGLVAFDATAAIYTSDGGSPGTQVGIDSEAVNISGAGTFTFNFPTPPVVAGGTTYWVVFSDVTGGGTGQARIRLTGAQSNIGTGMADDIGSIVSGVPIAGQYELKAAVTIVSSSTPGTLALKGNGSGVAVAEQAVTTTSTGMEHVLAFRVTGSPGDHIDVRVGSTSGGDQLLEETKVKVGWHVVAFTPNASPFYVSFHNTVGRTVYLDDVAILGSGASTPTALELENPYGESDLATLKWAQSADVMYFAHPSYPPHKLERRGNAVWSLVEVAFQDGPYLDENAASDQTLSVSATSGIDLTVTASGHSPFVPGDVGRLVRLRPSGEPGWGVITEYISSQQVKLEAKRTFGSTSATANWSLGAWSEARGYPGVVTFFEQRMVWAATREQPQSFWMSQSADLENMRVDSYEESAVEVQDDDGLNFTIAADQVNAIRWMSPGRQLILGTSGGEWSVTADGPVVTPVDIAVKRESTNGSADTLPLRISSIVLFVQRAKRKLLEFVFSLETDGFRTPDLTILADHITESGLREIVYQQEPDSQVHCVREDGVLSTLTYRREQDVVGWCRHILGGQFDGAAPVVESAATVPGNALSGSENRDEAWVAVKRTVNGTTFRSIEVFEAPFEGPHREAFDSDAAYDAAVLMRQNQAFYVDCGLSYSGIPTQMVSGLDHLEGETVAILADGALHPERIVNDGSVTLQVPASDIHVGLPYRHVFASLKLEAGAAAGTAVGKVKRVHGISLVLLNSLGLRIGPSIDRQREVPLRDVSDAMDVAVPLFSGERFVSFDGDFERDARIVISGAAPLPFTLLAAAPELKTNELI